MKKLLILIFSVLGIISITVKLASAQSFEDSFREKSNIVFFGGLVFHQDSEDIGNYYGGYLDYQGFKSANGKWTLGPYVNFSRSNSIRFSGLDESRSRAYAYGGGLSAGFYEANFSLRHQLFTGLALGISRESEEEIVKMEKGRYIGVQKDWLLNASLNLNLLKVFGLQPDLLPRSQMQLRLKMPLLSEKQAVWEDARGREKIDQSLAWDKTYFEAIAKQNIYQAPLNWRQEFWYTPKVLAFYSFSAGDARSFYGLGLELACYREFRDDFLSVGALYKVSRKFTDNYFIVSLNLNLSSLMRK